MEDLLIPLMAEYDRLLSIDAERKAWEEANPDKYKWQYKGRRVSRARLARVGVMIRQLMVDYENGMRPY